MQTRKKLQIYIGWVIPETCQAHYIIRLLLYLYLYTYSDAKLKKIKHTHRDILK